MRGECFYILAGDTSADLLAARLMCAIHSDINKPINWIGIGGEQMQQQGLETSLPMIGTQKFLYAALSILF